MSPEERRTRMVRMRQSVTDHNIYRWAGMLLTELARIPVKAGAKAS
jgi:trehalose-6-phosphate synthase